MVKNLVLLLLISYSAARASRRGCISLAEYYRNGNEEWTNVDLCQKNQDGVLTSLESNAFAKTPKLEELAIIGITNSVKNGAFSDLKNLRRLAMFNNSFDSLPAGSFDGIPLDQVYIIRSKVKYLQPNTFHVEKLRVVTIRHNLINVILGGVFNNTDIQELYLDNNEISMVEDGAFEGMDKLTKLSLRKNSLANLDIKAVMGAPPNLTHLWLSENALSKITQNAFKLPSLTHLLLESNRIYEIEPDGFSGLPNLKVLDISNNYVRWLPARIFPHKKMPKLEVFMFQHNQLTFLSDELFKRAPGLVYVSLGGNPWQCECYNKATNYLKDNNISLVCDEDYTSGMKPACIFSDKPNECVRDLEETKGLHDEYLSTVAKYKSTPKKKCNFGTGYGGAWVSAH